MSKYFTDDTSTLTNQLEEQLEETNYAMPTPTAIDKSMRDKIIQQDIPNPTSVEDHIAIVNHQNKTVNNMIKEITVGTAEEITQTFETLSTLELFERMNQISFLLVKMNSRLDGIEKAINGTNGVKTTQEYTQVEQTAVEPIKPDYQEQEKPKIDTSNMSPREQYALEKTDKLSPLEAAHKQLADGIKSNFPDEGYVGEGTNLEKIFPNMPDDAYQAAYSSINDIRNK